MGELDFNSFEEFRTTCGKTHEQSYEEGRWAA
jgi:hypothetical protein